MMHNTKERFGLVSILVHWLMALIILGLFGVGWYMVDLTYYDALYKPLPEIHKAVGMLLVPFFIFRIIWALANPRPQPVNGSKPVEIIGAWFAHIGMYLLIALILCTGYLIPTAEGAGIDVFGLFSVPASITSIPDQEDIAGLVHEYLSYALIGLVLVHSVAALKHHFIDKDNTLSRMLGISAPGKTPTS